MLKRLVQNGWALLAATIFVLSASGFVILHFVFAVAHEPEHVNSLLSPEKLYDLGTEATITELENEQFILAFKGSPVEITRTDIRKTIDDNFSVAFVNQKAIEVHTGLIDYLHHFSRDSIYFMISIQVEKDTLFTYLPELLDHKLSALPVCTSGEMIEIGLKFLTKGLNGNIMQNGFLQSLPHCRPPAPLTSTLSKKTTGFLEGLKQKLPTEIVAFPSRKSPDHSGYYFSMTLLRIADNCLLHFTAFSYLFMGILLGGIIWLKRASLPAALLWSGIPIVLAGALVLVASYLFTELTAKADILDWLIQASPKQPRAGKDWIALGSYALQEVTLDASRPARDLAWIFLVTGVVVTGLAPIFVFLRKKDILPQKK